MTTIATMECDALTIHSPLEYLFGQYKLEKEGIERIAGLMTDAEQLHFFFDAATVANRSFSAGFADFFQPGPAVCALNAKYWHKAMQLTDVLEFMPADKRNEWHNQIHEHKTPAFERDSVTATMIEMLNSRARFMAERVDGLFRALSAEHLTNTPQAFGKRFIIAGMLSGYGSFASIDYRRANYIHDLRCVIGKFLGREVPNSANTHNDLARMDHDGQWNDFDGGAFRIRLYKKGTAHMEVHPGLAWQLNKVLAFLHPMAIPAEFRTKPKRQPKEHILHHDLISFGVINSLHEGLPYDARCAKHLSWQQVPDDQVVEVMERLGGVMTDKTRWEFDYLIGPVLQELARTGRLPEQKSHQFYPTPRELAEIVVGLACIEPHHICLEPSAGQGGIADLMPVARTTCIEISPLHCAVLKAKGFEVICADFIWYSGTVTNKYDRIAMNPPFSAGRAVSHVRHAASMLSVGGVLVAIMPASNQGKTIVEGMAHEWSKVYDNFFKDASVSVVLLKLSVKGGAA